MKSKFLTFISSLFLATGITLAAIPALSGIVASATANGVVDLACGVDQANGVYLFPVSGVYPVSGIMPASGVSIVACGGSLSSGVYPVSSASSVYVASSVSQANPSSVYAASGVIPASSVAAYYPVNGISPAPASAVYSVYVYPPASGVYPVYPVGGVYPASGVYVYQAIGGNPTGTHNASGTYAWTPGTSTFTLTTATSDFVCDGPSVGTRTKTGVTITATTMTWPNDMTWTRLSGTAGDAVGTWTSTDSMTGNSYTLTVNANGTASVVGNIVSCSGISGGGGSAAKAEAQHWSSGYFVQLRYSNPAMPASSVVVTGPGIPASGVALTYNPLMSSWGSGTPESIIQLGTTYPTGLPLTYTFNITPVSGTPVTTTSTVSCFEQQFVTNISPLGSVTGNPTFSWTGITDPNAVYGVQVNDSTGRWLWANYYIPGASIAYNGPALTPGTTYSYVVSVQSSSACNNPTSGGGSHVTGSFTYAAGTAPSYAGTYSGTYAGSDAGTWTATVSSSGVVAATVNTGALGSIGGSGQVVLSTGALTITTSGTVAGVATFSGTINPTTGAVSGTWTGFNSMSGSFSGTPAPVAGYAGTYSGMFTGTDTGTWTNTISANGAITVTGYSNNLASAYTGSGQVLPGGSFTGATSTGSTFSGMINPATGVMSGTWVNATAGGSGSFSGNVALPLPVGTWTTKTPMPAARYGAAAGAVNGVLYVAGGVDAAGPDSALRAYNPATNSWSAMAPMPGGRYQGDGAAVINGQLYVAGGWTWTPALPNSNLWVYDPTTNAWSAKANMPTLSACGSSGAIGGKLYVTTACDGNSGWRNFLHVYDPATNAWSALAPSPNVHNGPAAGVINGKFYVAGGGNGAGVASNVLDVYDPATNAWSTLAPMPTARMNMASTVVNGRLYVIGGYSAASAYLSTVEIYDPVTNTWSNGAAMTTPRQSLAADVVNGVIYAVGGSDAMGALAVNEALSLTAAANPLIGTWAGQVNDGAIWNRTLTVNGNNTWSVSVVATDGSGRSVVKTGTYSYDATTFTATVVSEVCNGGTTCNSVGSIVSIPFTAISGSGAGRTLTLPLPAGAISATPLAFVAPTGTHTASGTYTWNATTGVLTSNWTSSDFVCGGPNLGPQTKTGVTITAATMSWPNDQMIWTRASGTAGDGVGTWTATDGTTGNSYTLTVNANGTMSVVGNIVSCYFAWHGTGSSQDPVNPHWLNIGIDDPLGTIQSAVLTYTGTAAVTGLGTGVLASVPAGAAGKSWRGFFDATNASAGTFNYNAFPTLPITYTLTITDTSGAVTTKQITYSGFNTNYASNISPSGNYTGITAPTFTWTAPPNGSYSYVIEVAGLPRTTGSFFWANYNVGGVTSAAYTGAAPLPPCSEVSVFAADINNNQSLAKAYLGNNLAAGQTCGPGGVTTTGQFDGTYTGSWTNNDSGNIATGTFTTALVNGVFTNTIFTITSGNFGIHFTSGAVSSSGAITGTGTSPTQCSSSVGTFTGQITGATMTMTYSRPASGTCGAESGAINATLTLGDTQPPTVPAGLTATPASATQVNLSWSASTDNVGVTAYKVYRGGTLLATLGNVTSYNDTGLTASTTYSYTVAACDAAGNCSAQSPAISATTGAVASATLTVSKSGTGSGTVSAPPGFSCNFSGGSCTDTQSLGAVITYTATPGTGSTFTGWSGACTGIGTCVVTMDANKSVTAAFTLLKAGQTIGTISFSPTTLAVGGATTASATATSNLAVSFSSTTPSICTVNGSTVTGVAAGVCTIAADQAGNATYNAATQVTQNITIAAGTAVTLNFVTGWNLVGNSVNAPLTVATTTFGDATKVTTVWKWIPATSKWAFYTPTMTDGGSAYAATKGYDFLTTINGGEGFWVNAKAAFTAPLPAGTSVSANYFQDQLDPTQNKLLKGWNLISMGDNITPSAFNLSLSTMPPTQSVPLNVTTLWAWDSTQMNWYFYASSLEANGTLTTYIASKNYLDFTVANKKLGQGVGFWVNHP